MIAPPPSAPTDALRRARLVWIAELCLIPLSNNVVAFITWKTGLDLFPVLAAILYTYIGIRHLRILPFGFVWSRRSLVIGTLAGLALAAPAIIFFIHPFFVSNVDYGPIAHMTVSGVMRYTLMDIPFLTALIEELVFRHWLFFEAKSPTRTILFNASIFTVWHGVAAFTAVAATQFGGSGEMLAVAYVGSLASVFVGGVVFAWVRHVTGSFVYSALTHCLSDASIVMVIWAVAHVAH
jgi:membrane protease YdiL (CAAX protease family)